jgi:hypothetical protein
MQPPIFKPTVNILDWSQKLEVGNLAVGVMSCGRQLRGRLPYICKKINPGHTNIFAEGCSVLHMNVGLVQGNHLERMLVGACNKDIKRILMIYQELQQEKYKLC